MLETQHQDCMVAHAVSLRPTSRQHALRQPCVTAVTMGDLKHCRNSQLCGFAQMESGPGSRAATDVRFDNLSGAEMPWLCSLASTFGNRLTTECRLRRWADRGEVRCDGGTK